MNVADESVLEEAGDSATPMLLERRPCTLCP